MTKPVSLGSSVDLLIHFCCSLNRRGLWGIFRNKTLTWEAEDEFIAIIRLKVTYITVVSPDVPSGKVSSFYGKSFSNLKPFSRLGNKGEKPLIL